MSRTKLTSTILIQLQQNQRLRIQLHHYQNLLREQDNFYLTALNNQQKTTKDILDQLILTQLKIKQLVKARICNNWKQQYDNLSQNISQYVKDVNQLVLSYNLMRQNWTQKMQQKSDLHIYYSQTLQECVQKFDKAQQIIQEMNQIIQDKDLQLKKANQQLQKLSKTYKKSKIQQQLQNKIIQINQTHVKKVKHYEKQVASINQHLQALKTQNQFLIQQNKKQKQNFKLKSIDYDLSQQKIVTLQQKLITLISQNQRLINLLQQMQNMQKSSKKQLSRVTQNQQQIIKKSISETQHIAYLQKMLAQVERENNQLIKMQKDWTNTQQNYEKNIFNLKLQIQHHEQLVFDLNSVNQCLKHQLQILSAQIEQYRSQIEEYRAYQVQMKAQTHQNQRQIHQKQRVTTQKQVGRGQIKHKNEKLDNLQEDDQQGKKWIDKKTKRKKQLVIKTQDQLNQRKINSSQFVQKQILLSNETKRNKNKRLIIDSNNLDNQQIVLRQLHQTLNNQNDLKQEKNDDNNSNLKSNQKKFNLQRFQIKNLHFQHSCCSPKIKMGNLHNWGNFPF